MSDEILLYVQMPCTHQALTSSIVVVSMCQLNGVTFTDKSSWSNTKILSQ